MLSHKIIILYSHTSHALNEVKKLRHIIETRNHKFQKKNRSLLRYISRVEICNLHNFNSNSKKKKNNSKNP